jgi:hypothetical protein
MSQLCRHAWLFYKVLFVPARRMQCMYAVVCPCCVSHHAPPTFVSTSFILLLTLLPLLLLLLLLLLLQECVHGSVPSTAHSQPAPAPWLGCATLPQARVRALHSQTACHAMAQASVRAATAAPLFQVGRVQITNHPTHVVTGKQCAGLRAAGAPAPAATHSPNISNIPAYILIYIFLLLLLHVCRCVQWPAFPARHAPERRLGVQRQRQHDHAEP